MLFLCPAWDSSSSENILHVITQQFWKFMLGCRFSFEAYAKNVKEKAFKCSYQGTVARNSFKSDTNSDVRSKIHLVQRNIICIGQSVQA